MDLPARRISITKKRPKSLEEWLQAQFPFFCRRVCQTCNPVESVKLMLLECPIIKLDAYAALEPNHTNGEVAKRIRPMMEKIVTAELVEAVGTAMMSTSKMGTQRKKSEETHA